MKVKIYGAGSIGNHMAHACRSLGWDVLLCDLDPSALNRTRNEIYPSRYGVWDNKIALSTNSEASRFGHDLIIIGTPPDTHLPLALEAIAENPKAILIEKPFCPPDLRMADEFIQKATGSNILSFVGYDHVVSRSVSNLTQKISSFNISDVISMDVNFREHWGGIFAAHPWLDGEKDSYLGFYMRGGGALGEHSHGINLWQHIARSCGAGRIVKLVANLNFKQNTDVNYDYLSFLNFETESGLVGRCCQDVITLPSEKKVDLKLADHCIELSISPTEDKIINRHPNIINEMKFPKTRPDDFILELEHIWECIQRNEQSDLISAQHGLETALIIAASFLSNERKRPVEIDYSKGYNASALSVV